MLLHINKHSVATFHCQMLRPIDRKPFHIREPNFLEKNVLRDVDLPKTTQFSVSYNI